MNADGSVNGLDVDPFVATVVGADGQPGGPSTATSASATVEHVGSRAPELHHHVRDLHKNVHGAPGLDRNHEVHESPPRRLRLHQAGRANAPSV